MTSASETGDVHTQLEPGWRRAAFVSALRSLVLSVVIIGLALASVSAAGPNRHVAVIVAILYVVLWLGLFALYLRWQLRRIRTSDFPLIRGVEALIVGVVLFLTIFAKAYLLLSTGDAKAFTEPLDHFTAYYFAVTVLATVGFGDITPVTVPARSITMVQMILDLGILAIVVRLLTTEVRRATARRRGSVPPTS